MIVAIQKKLVIKWSVQKVIKAKEADFNTWQKDKIKEILKI